MAAAAVALLALGAACAEPTSPVAPPAASTHPTPSDAVAAAGASPTSGPAPSSASGIPAVLQPAPAGEIVAFQVRQGADVVVDARSSGLARYGTSSSCEVPRQPCYDAPTLDKVARIDLGAPPEVPGTQTTFVTGHANRYHPDDPKLGIFSRLQDVRNGADILVTTTTGVFGYVVDDVLRVPFDRLTSNEEVVRVRPNTLIAISCEIAPDRSSYLGNVVVIASLHTSARS